MGDISRVSTNCVKFNIPNEFYVIELIDDPFLYFYNNYVCVHHSWLVKSGRPDGLSLIHYKVHGSRKHQTKKLLGYIRYSTDNVFDATRFIIQTLMLNSLEEPEQNAPISYKMVPTRPTSPSRIETITSQILCPASTSSCFQVTHESSTVEIQSDSPGNTTLQKHSEATSSESSYKHKKFSMKQSHKMAEGNIAKSFVELSSIIVDVPKEFKELTYYIHLNTYNRDIETENPELFNDSSSMTSPLCFDENFISNFENLYSKFKKMFLILKDVRRGFNEMANETEILSDRNISDEDDTQEIVDEPSGIIQNIIEFESEEAATKEININAGDKHISEKDKKVTNKDERDCQDKTKDESAKKRRTRNRKFTLPIELQSDEEIPEEVIENNTSKQGKKGKGKGKRTLGAKYKISNTEKDKDYRPPSSIRKTCDLTLSQFIESEDVPDQDIMEVERNEIENMDTEINDNPEENDDDKNNDAPPKTQKKARKFTLPDEYDANNSRWTLKYKSKKDKKGLVELMPHSNVFVEAIQLDYFKSRATGYSEFARMLLTEIFSDVAVETCSLTGKRANAFDPEGKEVRPGLDESARMVLLNYVQQHGIKQKWGDMKNERVIASIRSSLQEKRRKAFIRSASQFK